MPRHHRLDVVARATVLLVGAILLSACGSDGPKAAATRQVATQLAEPVAFGAKRDGDVLFGERLTGNVRAIHNGTLVTEPVAHVESSSDGQRGLLGLAMDAQDHVFVAYTERAAPQRIVVSRVTGTVEQIVWIGPPSQGQANGGHIAFMPDGTLLIGIGELAARPLAAALGAPSKGLAAGRMLLLDPNGRRNQLPRVMSSGWHNPYAFVVRSDGAVWVADNAPNGTPERLARADRNGQPTDVIEFTEELIPTALTISADNELLMCTLTGSAVRRQRDGEQFSDSITTSPCTRALYAVPGTKRVLFSNESTIFELS